MLSIKITPPPFYILPILLLLLFSGSCDNRLTQSEQAEPTQTKFIPFGQQANSKNKTLSDNQRPPSPFGCTLATLNSKQANYTYRDQSFYIKFPASVMKQAKGKVTRPSLCSTASVWRGVRLSSST